MLKFGICVCLLAVFAGANTTDCNNSDITSRLYTISRNNVVCIGAAVGISSRNIIITTAAHCVYRIDAAQLTVSDMTNPGNKKIRPIDKVIVHPYYMPPLVDYDVALLKIKIATNTNFNGKTEFFKLSDKEPKSDSDSMLTVELNSTMGTAGLIQARFEDRKSCRAKLAKNVTVSSKMLCADFSSTHVKDGSPLLFQEKLLVGIASYGLGGNLPKIFTNIANREIFSFIDNYI